MAQVVEKPLVTEAKLLKKAYFDSPDGHQHSPQFERVVKIVEGLSLEDFKIPEHFPSFPTEGVVHKEFGLRVSLFFLPKGTRTLLHDHPHMYVINKVLKGKFMKHQYALEDSEFQKTIPQEYVNRTNSLSSFEFPIVTSTKSVEEISVGSMGLITPEDNLHAFETDEDSIFLDVIAPDYDDVDIFFNTYEELERLSGDKVKLKMGPPRLQQNFMVKVEMI